LSLRPGTLIGDYEVIGVLGVGGMGAVYQVRHLISERIEAMKVLLPDLALAPALAERFMREIRLQASLSHSNIASLHNALRGDNQLLMVMEFVDGDSLGEILRAGPLEQIQVADTGIQVLAALDYAHSRGVVHSDVKPSNIMISSAGVVKLMDFGIARGINELNPWTQTGTPVGSMYYMSPEQVRAGIVDERSDIYATGVTLFEALTGQRPIRGNSTAEVLQAQIEKIPVAPNVINPALSQQLSDAIMKALEKDPGKRFQTASEFQAELFRVRVQLPLPLEYGVPRRVIQGSENTPVTGTHGSQTPLGRSSAVSNPSSPASPFDALGLEELRRNLAEYIGPLAKVLVDRAAKSARSWQELYEQLASEIPPGKEREQFLANCPRT
jgi:serine/threonine protein kinase